MKARLTIQPLRPWLVVLVLWGGAFALACRLTDQAVGGGAGLNSLIVSLFGDSRLAASTMCYEAADRSFHKGVGYYQPRAFTDWFSAIRSEIVPAGHVHLQDQGAAEMIPWLYFATRMDPQNITAYLVTVFWLSDGMGRLDLAEQALAEAQAHNPNDYRIYLEKGRLALKQGRLAEAARWLDAGLQLWPSRENPQGDQPRRDRAELLAFRGLLYETTGNLAAACAAYQAVLGLFPGRAVFKDRLENLKTTGRAAAAPAEIWKALLIREHVCDRHDDRHDQAHP